MDWKEYENIIYKYFKDTYPDAEISFNQKVIGRNSKAPRQIDCLIEGYIAGTRFRLIVDCKFFNKPVDVKDVESFISMVEDADAIQGILITNKGYSEAAINRAYYGPARIELDILNLDELKKLQGYGAIVHQGLFGAVISAPFGWIIDGHKREYMLATSYQRGLDFEKATENKEWMYFNIYRKDENARTLQQLLTNQEANVMIKNPRAEFEYQNSIKRKDNARTCLRIIKREHYSFKEYTGFVEFDEFFIFAVLFSPVELAIKNIRKLEYVIQRLLPLEVNYKSVLETDLQTLEGLLKSSQNMIAQAEILIQQGDLLLQLDRTEDAIKKYQESISVLPTSYGAIKRLIEIYLKQQRSNDLEREISRFFELGPTNPIICQDLMDLFIPTRHIVELVEVFKVMLNKYRGQDEVEGNINFHMASVYSHLKNLKKQQQCLTVAKKKFEKVFPADHEVFRIIKQMTKIK